MASFIVAAVISGGDDKLIIGALVSGGAMLVLLAFDWATSRNQNRHGISIIGNVVGSVIAGRARDIHFHAPSQPVLPQNWEKEAGAPRFDPRPGIDNSTSQLLLDLYQRAGDDVTPEARWSGPGIENKPAVLMLRPAVQGAKQAWRLKGTPVARPAEGIETVSFELWFRWRDVECHGLWEWPLRLHAKGHLVLESTAANIVPVRTWWV